MATRKEFKTAQEAVEKLTLEELTELRVYMSFQIQNLKAKKCDKMAQTLKKNGVDVAFVEFEDEDQKIRRDVK